MSIDRSDRSVPKPSSVAETKITATTTKLKSGI